jgi:hypothetical protein
VPVVPSVFRVQFLTHRWHGRLKSEVDRVLVALVILVWQAQIFACIYLWQRINKCKKRRPNMRFMEIANPEDQLALWKLISDKMWAAFAQPAAQGTSSQPSHSSTPKGRAASPAKSVARPIPKISHKASAKSKAKAGKPKRAPMALAPKPLPKPNPQQVTSTQATKQQTQQQQQLAQHLHKELMKPNPQQRIYPQPPTPIQKPVTPIKPMTNGYDERDKDELVMHSRSQHPFKTISQIKSAFSGQKRGF